MAIYKGFCLHTSIYSSFKLIDSIFLNCPYMINVYTRAARLHAYTSCRQQIESLGSARMDKRLGDGISFFFREPVLK